VTETTWVEVSTHIGVMDAEAIEVHGRFAVTHCRADHVHPQPDCWSVTHTPSGLACISGAPFERCSWAARELDALAGPEWDFNEPLACLNALNAAGLLDRARAIQDEAGLVRS